MLRTLSCRTFPRRTRAANTRFLFISSPSLSLIFVGFAQCPFDACEFKDAKPSQIKAHYAKCHTAHTKVPCDKCSEVFRDKSAKNRHMKELHGGEEWVCPLCQDKFSRKRNLDAHVLKHADPVCGVCNITFNLRKELLAHVRAFHKEDHGEDGVEGVEGVEVDSDEEVRKPTKPTKPAKPEAMDTALIVKQIAAQIKATQAELSSLKRAKAQLGEPHAKRKSPEPRELTQAEVVMKATEAALAARALGAMQANQSALALRAAQVAQVYQAAKAAQAVGLAQKRVVKRPKVVKVTEVTAEKVLNRKSPAETPATKSIESPIESLIEAESEILSEILSELPSPVQRPLFASAQELDELQDQDTHDLQKIDALQAAAKMDKCMFQAHATAYPTTYQTACPTAHLKQWSDAWSDPWKAALFNPFAQAENPWLIPTTEERVEVQEVESNVEGSGSAFSISAFSQDAFPLFSSATWGTDPFCLSQY